ncbi:MAG: hypothetical protein EXS05_16230 [Planctomycetaceae bacterium]|nr:hypothetical protein [Planctomycetaceae bacterium]
MMPVLHHSPLLERAGKSALVVIAWGVVLGFLPAGARAETLSVQQLNEKVDQWRISRKDPPAVRFQIEGRGVTLGRNRVQFKNCKLSFESEAELPDMTRRNGNLEVTGTVLRDSKNSVFSVRIHAVRELPPDLETFIERRREIRGKPADLWYKLGDWAAQRGKFYSDHELTARSEEAYMQALDIERQALPRDDAAALFALAEKSRRVRLPENLSQQLVHEGVLISWRSSRKATGPALVDLLKSIAERLPGSTEPLPSLPADVQKEYLAKPRETYDAADAAKRRTLHRLLYVDVALRSIAADLAADGSNGFVVAEQLDKLVPEQHALAETWRGKALAAKAKEVDTLSKTEMLALTRQYQDRKQPEAALQLIESWLTLRFQRLEPDDTEGLIQLSDEYRALLKRNESADRLLKDAWSRNRDATDIAERLQQAGYKLFEGTWMTDTEYVARPEGQMEQAIRAGRVDTGMTASQVRRSLGEPQRLARSATSGQINEVWTYDQSTASKLVVRFKRNRRQSELTVVEVAQTAAR